MNRIIESENQIEFMENSKKNNILWYEVDKENRNSIIEYGSDKYNNIFCLKNIPIGNEDFFYIENFPKFGEILTCWRELYIYQKMEKTHKDCNSKNYIPLYNNFISMREDRPYLSLLFPYIPMTLKDIMVYETFTKSELNSIYIQIFFLGYYLFNGNIKHNDIHICNILIDILPEKENLLFIYDEKKYILPSQNKILYLIDFGISEIESDKTILFEEWKIFFSRLEKLFEIPPLFSTTSSFREIFDIILSFEILEISL
jgi:serine/threonine protein kinase